MKPSNKDHLRIVFGLRRAVRKVEKSYDMALCWNASPSILDMLRVDRNQLLKVLLAYQLATYRL